MTKRPADPGGSGSPAKVDPKKGKGSSKKGTVEHSDSQLAVDTASQNLDNLSLRTNETLPPVSETGPSDDITEFTDTQPLTPTEPSSSQTEAPASNTDIHAAEMSEELRKACIPVERHLAFLASLNVLPRVVTSGTVAKAIRRTAKGVIQTVLAAQGVTGELLKAATMKCEERVEAFITHTGAEAFVFGPCTCCAFSGQLWAAASEFSPNPSPNLAPALPPNQPLPAEAPPVSPPPVPPPSEAVLKILSDPAVLRALSALPSHLTKVDGALTQLASLSSRAAALEQNQAILSGRADASDEAVIASVRSKTDLLTRLDVVSKKVDTDLAKSVEQREAFNTAEAERQKAEESRKKIGKRIWEEFKKRDDTIDLWETAEEERAEGEERRKRVESEAGEKEHQRQLAEESRRQAEVARENRTAGVEAAEVLRKEMEFGRVRGEETRRDAEIARQRAEELRSMTDKGRREALPTPGAPLLQNPNPPNPLQGLLPNPQMRTPLETKPAHPPRNLAPPSIPPTTSSAWNRPPVLNPLPGLQSARQLYPAAEPLGHPPNHLLPIPTAHPTPPPGFQARPPSSLLNPTNPPQPQTAFGNPSRGPPRPAAPKPFGKYGVGPHSNPEVEPRTIAMCAVDEFQNPLPTEQAELLKLVSRWGDGGLSEFVGHIENACPLRQGYKTTALVMDSEEVHRKFLNKLASITAPPFGCRPDDRGVTFRDWTDKKTHKNQARKGLSQTKVAESASVVRPLASASGRTLLNSLPLSHSLFRKIETWLADVHTTIGGRDISLEDLPAQHPINVNISAELDLYESLNDQAQGYGGGGVQSSYHPGSGGFGPG